MVVAHKVNNNINIKNSNLVFKNKYKSIQVPKFQEN